MSSIPIPELESNANIALVSLSKSQEVLAPPQPNLRRSQRRIEKEREDALNSSAYQPIPLEFSLGLNRSQFVDFGMDLAFPEQPLLGLSQSQGVSSRLRSSRGLGTSQTIKAEPPLSRSQEIRLRVSNTLNKSDPFDDGSTLRPVSGPVAPLSYGEMRVLAEQLVGLSHEDLQAVLDFVRGQEPTVLQTQPEDAAFQFDLGVLKPETLFSIKRFVENKAASFANPVNPVVFEKDEYIPVSSGRPSRQQSGKTVPRPAADVMNIDMNNLECPECHKRFADKSNLAKHVRTHTGSKPFVCDQCGKSFRHSSTLKDHMNTHEAVRPYVCHYDNCGKRFSNMANLKRHERTHTDSKPFICQFCGRPFNQSSNCKQHEKKCGGSTTPIKRAAVHEDINPAAFKKQRKDA